MKAQQEWGRILRYERVAEGQQLKQTSTLGNRNAKFEMSSKRELEIGREALCECNNYIHEHLFVTNR